MDTFRSSLIPSLNAAEQTILSLAGMREVFEDDVKAGLRTDSKRRVHSQKWRSVVLILAFQDPRQAYH